MLPLVVAVALIGGGLGTREVVRIYSDASDRRACQDNLKKLVLAIHNYEAAKGTLPPAYVLGKDGKPWHSWRVLILPYLDRKDLYDQYHFDEPWNGPQNIQLVDQMPEIFGCPADDTRHKGRTSYLAIVGSQTAWPGPQSTTLEELTSADGTANTTMLIETTNSDIPWTEPRDITMSELFPDDDSISPRFSSKHDDIIHMAMCDGAVRSVRASLLTGGRRLFHAYVTAWGGGPYRGKWLPGEEQTDAGIAEFPPEVRAETLKASDIVGHLHGPISNQRNSIWCATMQIAWDEMRQEIGAAPQISDSKLAEGLAKNPFPRSALGQDAYVARMGSIGSGIKEKITKEMHQRFPGVQPTLPATDEPTDVVAYCFLQKNLPFKARFDALSQPLTFHAADRDIKVKAFGFDKLKRAKSDQRTLQEQVTVLSYLSDENFVIQLRAKSDEIVLAKVAAGPTLSETLAIVQKRIAASERIRQHPEDDETLMVPLLSFNVLKEYQELRRRTIENFRHGKDFYIIDYAQQSVRFLLNERGARIESEFLDPSYVGDGHGKIEPPKPRRFVLDKPFLLYVQESNAKVPYLVVWVANGEIMHKSDAAVSK
jgi:hypothetical protein